MKEKSANLLKILFIILIIVVAALLGYFFGFKNGYQSIKFAITDTKTEDTNGGQTETDDSGSSTSDLGMKVYDDKVLGIRFSYPSGVNVQKQSKGVAIEFSDEKVKDRLTQKERSASAAIDIYDSVYSFTGGYKDIQSYISFLGNTVSKYKKNQLGQNFWEEYDELGEGYEHNYVLEKNGKVYNVNMADQSYEAAGTVMSEILNTFEVTK